MSDRLARVKRLIVNADDFGMTAGVNHGIIQAHQHGIVTSTTLMANGAAFEDAAALAKGNASLSIGCHVDLVHLKPVLPASDLPSLTAHGRFRHGIGSLAAASIRQSLSVVEIAAEAVAQIRHLQQAGLAISHFDSHKHTHAFPPVLRGLLRAAQSCGVRAVRNPFEPARWNGIQRAFRRPGLAMRIGAVWASRPMARQFLRLVRDAGLVTTDGTLGIAFTGHWDRELLCSVIRNIPQGTWELVVHPGYDDSSLRAITSLTASRETELRLLTSKETRCCIEDAGVELISFREL